jgi:hypothetical protein
MPLCSQGGGFHSRSGSGVGSGASPLAPWSAASLLSDDLLLPRGGFAQHAYDDGADSGRLAWADEDIGGGVGGGGGGERALWDDAEP